MIWLNPSALFALAAVAAPILIHVLIQRRAERFPFPTLRFLRPTRLAAIRRHVLEDVTLLAVRIAILAAAVAALAGPLFLTAARRQGWDRRVVRALVTDGAGADLGRPETAARRAEQAPAQREQTFAAAALEDGIQRAILWLEAAPPARREIVVSSAFPIGSITAADIATVPEGIGLRFERRAALPASRTVPGGRLLTSSGVRERQVTFDGDRTTVRDGDVGMAVAWPIEIVAPKAEQPIADAAIAAVLSQHVWAAPPDGLARLVLPGMAPAPSPGAPGSAAAAPSLVAQDSVGAPGSSPASPAASAIQLPWMATAIARIAADGDLRTAAARVATGLADARFTSAPWQTVASAGDGRPLAAAAASADRLLVVSAAAASDIVTPLLLRAMADGMAGAPDLRRAEVTTIPDARLRQWSRPAGPPPAPRTETIDGDDRRWLWLAALVLMGVEMWIRRTRAAHAPVVHDPVAHDQVVSGLSRTEDAREKGARVA